MLETVTLRGRRLQPFGAVGVSRRGLGLGSPSDFSSLDPAVQAVFNNGPGAQLQAEGADSPTITGQQSNFAAQYNALVQTASGVSWQQLANAAAQYVGLGNTVQGAQQIVGGLVDAFTSKGGDTAGVINSFTGIAIAEVGTAVAVGAVSAGVGAAIVAGIELVSALVGSIFDTPAPTAQVAGCGLPYTPAFVIPGSEVWSIDGQKTLAGPSTATYSQWRKFPNPNTSGDSWWFQNATGVGGDCGAQSWQNAGCVNTDWNHGSWSDRWALCGAKSGAAWRPIDGACFENGSPVYAQLESDNLMLWTPWAAGAHLEAMPLLQLLQQAFFIAWKANREYDFNGLARQNDWQVLQQVILRWNMAREPGNGVSLPAATWSPLTYGSPPDPVTCYMQMVLNDLQRNSSSVVTAYDSTSGRGVLNSDGSIHVNTGPLKSLPKATPPASTSSSSSGGKVLVGAGALAGASAGGLYLYARHEGITMRQALRRIFRR